VNVFFQNFKCPSTLAVIIILWGKEETTNRVKRIYTMIYKIAMHVTSLV